MTASVRPVSAAPDVSNISKYNIAYKLVMEHVKRRGAAKTQIGKRQ